jgi:hypothetical protein
MRPARTIGGVGLLLALAVAARAEPVAGEATVTRAVEARSGPSDSYYATSRLQPGDRVQIVDEKQLPWLAGKLPPTGWVAIKPPRDSFSWVNKRFLTLSGSTAQVLGEVVPVRTGSTLYNGRPTTEWIKLQHGAQVIVVGKEEVDAEDNSLWVPIAPAPQEVRFIPADAVKAAPPPVQTVSSSPPPGATGVESAGAAPPPDDPLWAQAKKAQSDGNNALAEKLFRQLAQETKDHDLCIRCYNEIHFLRQKVQGTAAANYPMGRPAGSPYPSAATDNRLVPAPAFPYQQPVGPAPAVPTGRATSQYTYVRDNPSPPPGQTPPGGIWQSPGAAPTASQWRGPGLLVRSTQPVNGQQAYALDLGKGQPLLYVLPQPGVNLDSYVNRTVWLAGPVGYHSGYRREFMTAVEVRQQ